MTYQKALSILSIFLLASCGSNTRSEKVETKATFPVKIRLSDCFDNATESLKLSDIAESISYIKLETTKESLLGGILSVYPIEIGYLIVDNTESIFLFDKEGKFKWKINKKGRGPEEYVEFSGSMGVDTINKEIIIPDNKNVVVYDFDGRFRRKFKIPFATNGAYILPSGHYVLWCDNPFEKVLARIIDRSGRIIQVFGNHNVAKRLNQRGESRLEAFTLIDPYKNGIFLSNKDTIWFLNNDQKMDPRFIIDSRLSNHNDWYYLYGYNVISQSLISFVFFDPFGIYLYDIRTGRFKLLTSGLKDDIDYGPDCRLGTGDGNVIVGILSPLALIPIKTEIRTGSVLSEIQMSLKEDDNPVLRIIKLKD